MSIPELARWVEETAHSACGMDRLSGGIFEKIVIVSNDIDILAILMHYMLCFLSLGLKELWEQFRTG